MRLTQGGRGAARPGGDQAQRLAWGDRWLLAILAGAFLVRWGYGLVAGLGVPPQERPFVIDEQEYYLAGQMLAAGHGFSFYDTFAWTRAPLYPLFVAGIFRLAPANVSLVLAIQAALSTLTLYGLAVLAGRIAPPFLSARAARRGAALLGALWLPFTLFAQLLVSETVFLGLFVGALVLLARWADRRPAAWVREQGFLLLGAGVALGLAALTRSTALAFVPLAAGWVWWVARPSPPAPLPAGEGGTTALPLAGGEKVAVRRESSPAAGDRRRRFQWLAPVLLLAGAGGVIAPWTARNLAAYGVSPGGPVIIDTSSGYNLWLAANGVHNAERLAADLRGIAGVLPRQAHALAQAEELIAADPGAFLAKGLKESLDLWRINFTAEERQVGGYTAGRVPAWHLLAVLVLEDGLYLVLGVLALIGLAMARPDPVKGLIGLWALLWMAMAFVFFAVTRFRFPVVACLIPWAPVGAAWLRHIKNNFAFNFSRDIARMLWAPALIVLFVLLVGPALPVGDAFLGVRRWFEQAPFRVAEEDLRQGDTGAALAHYAQANPQLADTRYGTLAARIASAREDTPTLNTIARDPLLDVGATSVYSTRMESYVLLGQIARLTGDNAQAARLFTNRAVNDATPPALAWAALHVGASPANGTRLDVGSGLDIGWVQGMYAPERDGDLTYRWTAAAAQLVPPAAPFARLLLRWNGWRPAGWPPAQVRITVTGCEAGPCIDKETTLNVPNDIAWHDAALDLPPIPPSAVVLRVNTFVPGGYDPRDLGIKIDQIEWVK